MVALDYLVRLPMLAAYTAYDRAASAYFNWGQIFNGWGIHLFVGKFGAGKTSLMITEAYQLCKKYPQLSILTNIKVQNFPSYTKILPLNTAIDILNAPPNTLVLIDEIGTIFNSRDFSGGKNAVPKPLFQHLCQCRKRRMMIYATVQRFNLLDKQIRDITADVTACHTHFKHPFVRIQTGYTYDIEEYELYSENKTYSPVQMYNRTYIQRNHYRQLYDTSELVTSMLGKDYLSDEEILANREGISPHTEPLDRKQKRTIRKRKNAW